MQKRLKNVGIEVQISSVGADLGADCVAGGPRQVTLQKGRLKKVSSGIKQTLKFGRCTKGLKTRKLVFTGVLPRAPLDSLCWAARPLQEETSGQQSSRASAFASLRSVRLRPWRLMDVLAKIFRQNCFGEHLYLFLITV